MSRLTLRPLHRGQTSQGKCARVVALAFDPINGSLFGEGPTKTQNDEKVRLEAISLPAKVKGQNDASMRQ